MDVVLCIQNTEHAVAFASVYENNKIIYYRLLRLKVVPTEGVA